MKNIEQRGFCASCQKERILVGEQTVEIPEGEEGTVTGIRGICPVCGSTMLIIEE